MKISLRHKLFHWFDERVGWGEIAKKHLHGYLLPENINAWYSMGSILLALFGLQVLTGVLLMIYYRPTTEDAFSSIRSIMTEVPYGWLIRSIHAAGANVMIFILFLHMLSTLFMGSYKKPRELNWVTGCVLFAFTLGLALSGYLLPWSQLSYWATTVATNTVTTIPRWGDTLLLWVRGSAQVSQATLGRFFALHVAVLPLLVILFILLHLFFVRSTGISTPPTLATQPRKIIPFYPDYLLEDLKMIYLALALVAFLVFFYPGFVFPEDSLIPADPFSTPEHIKPEWYFLANYQLLRLIPNKILGILVQVVAGLFIVLLPFIDRSPERHPLRRPAFTLLSILALLGYIGLIYAGLKE